MSRCTTTSTHNPEAKLPPLHNNQNTSHKLASLLQEVATIMDTLTGSKILCGEDLDVMEGDLLCGLTEMVLTMEEEVEGMIELADTIDEYAEEVEMVGLERVGDVVALKDGNDDSVGQGEGRFQLSEKGGEGWKGHVGSKVLEDGKESVRIRFDSGNKGSITLSGMLEEMEKDVLSWKLRGESVDSDNYEINEQPEEAIATGIFVPISNYRNEGVIKQSVISVSPKILEVNGKFRDSGLGLISPVGVMKKGTRMGGDVGMKTSDVGMKTKGSPSLSLSPSPSPSQARVRSGLGLTRREKTIRKPRWV